MENREDLAAIKDLSREDLARIRALARRLSGSRGADFDQYFAVAAFFSQIELSNSRKEYLDFLSSPAGRLLTAFRQELLDIYLVDPFVEEAGRLRMLSGPDQNQDGSDADVSRNVQISPRDKLRIALSQFSYGSFHSGLSGAEAFLILDLVDSLAESSWRQGHGPAIWINYSTGQQGSLSDVLDDFILEARKKRLSSQSLDSIKNSELSLLEDFSLLFETHFRHLFKPIEIESPGSLLNQKLQALQVRIYQDIGADLHGDLMAKTALIIELSKLSSKNDWIEKQLADLVSEIRQESNPEKKKQAVQYLMKAIKWRYVQLDVRGVEEWANYLIQEAQQRILQAKDVKQRASFISEVAESLRDSLKDSPFSYVIDSKIDELLIQIRANREESRLLSSVKSFEGGGEATDAFTATHAQVDRINKSTWAMDAIALTMTKRTAAENELLRRFIVLGEGLESRESQATQKLLIEQILDLYAAKLQQLESVLLSGNIKLSKPLGQRTSDPSQELLSNRERLGVLLESELKALHERFKRLPPAQQVVISASLMSLPGEDSSILESTSFNEKAVSEFLMEEGSKAGPLRLLAQQFLAAFSPEQRALLIARSEIENQGLVPDNNEDLKRHRARRFSALGSALQPFGDKLIQILARNQAIDPTYREIFKIKEDRASTPSYETLYQMLEPHLLPEEVKQLDRISEVKAGSVKITLIVDFKDDAGRVSKKVFSIRRPSIERSVDIVYQKTRQALREAAQQKGGEILKPFISVPDDAYSLVKAEMKFEEEFQRTQEAFEQYRKAEVGKVAPRRVQSVLPERLSQVGRDQQAIVFPYHEGIRLDQIPDDSLSRDLTEEIIRTEIDFLLADKEEIRFDADRHQGNILIVSGERGFEAVHIDFGQWVSVSRPSRDFFARLIFGYLQDGLKRNGDFDSILSVLSQSAGQSTSDFAASEFWKSLKNDLRELQKKSSAEMTEAQRAGELITTLLYVKEALVATAPESQEQKRLTDDLFKLTKSLETLGGLSSRFEGLFASVFMDRIQNQLDPEQAFQLFVDPSKVISQFFSQPAPIQCQKALNRAAEALVPRLRGAR